MHGTRAGNLDAGSVIGGAYPLMRGQRFMIGLDYVKNVGREPIRIESVRPQSSSPNLKATAGRVWILPRRWHLSLPSAWPGWPPNHPPTKPGKGVPQSWIQPHPDYLSIPTSRTIPPGRQAQLVYGIFLRSRPSAATRITALRITFKQGGTTYVWILPEPVHLCARTIHC